MSEASPSWLTRPPAVRSAAKKAAASVTAQLVSSPEQSEDEHAGKASNPFQTQPKVVRRYKSTAKLRRGTDVDDNESQDALGAMKPPLPIALTSPGKSKISAPLGKSMRGKKRQRSPFQSQSSDEAESDLTPPPSLPSSPARILRPPPWEVPAHIETPVPHRKPKDTSSPSSPVKATSPRKSGIPVKPAGPIKPLSPRKPTASVKPAGPVKPASPVRSVPRSTKPTSPDSWDLSKCASFVFVLVDRHGQAVDDETDSEDQGLMWWPGKVANMSPHSIPLCVSVYGQITPTSPPIVKLQAPSADNIQPMNDHKGKIRFSESSFALVGFQPSPMQSPRKKAKLDGASEDSGVSNKWKEALQKMKKDYDDDGDDAYALDLFVLHPTSTKKAKTPEAPSVDSLSDDEPWVAPPPDPDLQIPGDVVLAREKLTATLYWPAKLEAYLPPEKPSQKPRYQVVFLDTKQLQIPRSWFYTSDEPEFATCKIGVWESAYREDSDTEEAGDDVNDDTRPASPPPILPVPAPEKFRKLTIPEQFAYVKPILVATLNDRYEPAKKRHADFMRGGKQRADVMKNVTMRGNIPVEDVRAFSACLSRWALREERRAKASGQGDSSVNKLLEAMPSSSSVSLPPSSPLEMVPPSSPAIDPPSEITPQQTPSSTESKPLDPDLDRPHSQKLDDTRSQPPRQRGCEAYESLSGVEKLEYVLNVLHYETILQIILWRSGKRFSIDLLSPEEEQRLHNLAHEEAVATDWVRDVTRLRDSKRRILLKNEKRKDDGGSSPKGKRDMALIGGTRSRPRSTRG